ncbi:hypothetical protein [Streptomyces collinus]|uniref:hypothetical protein n=1 Tax=Streptomyces collinus TaxID=42684 RepID=UPI0033FB76E6
MGSSGAPLDNGPIYANAMAIATPRQPVHRSLTQEVSPTNPPAGLAGVFGYGQLHHAGGTWDLTFHRTGGSVRGQTRTLPPSLTDKSFTCH